MKIAVCVCTYRRPEGLRNLLQHLGQIECDEDILVVVADNDSVKQEGISVIEKMSSSYRWPLTGHVVPEPGVSYARNTAASKALQHEPDFVAYIDDDEWPTVNWLKELIRVQQEYDSDAVGGPTQPVFPDSATPLQRSNPYYGAALDLPDGSTCQLEASGNFLIRASVLRAQGPIFFLPEFAQSGGEDLAFFDQLKQAGRSMRWAANAVVYEPVPEDRLSDQWMKQRVTQIANSRVRMMQLFHPGFIDKTVRVIKTIGLFVVASLLSIAGIVNPRLAEKARIMRWKFWGKLTAHLNIKAAT